MNVLVCKEYEARINALIDDELTAQERAQVLEHMAQCPACHAYWEELLQIRDALREPVEVPAGFADGVMARVRETAQDSAATQRKTLRFPLWKRFAGLAACCAVVLLGIWAMDFPAMLGGSTGNSAPQRFAREDNGSMTGSAESYGIDTADSADNGAYNTNSAACDALPESGPEADDAAALTTVLATDSEIAAAWVRDTLGESWISGARYALSEEQYSALRELLVNAGERFNEIMGEQDSGMYQLLAE